MQTKSLGFRIRPYTGRDEAFIIGLAREAFAEFSHAAGERTRDMVRSGKTLVAQSGGRPIGFVTAEFSKRDVGHIIAIAVSYPERGRGIGARLLRAAEELARKQGASRLELCTADGNLSALGLFLRSGFTVHRRIPRYYARGQAADLLVKHL